MKKKILEFIRKYQMIRPGDSVCVGFSGGADSVCLLELLYELREELSIRLEAVHVNHNLRGRESDGDQDFAEEFCRKRGIPLHLYSFEVKKMAGNLGCGLEEAGRQARRNAYGDCVRRLGGARIALAHHQNDLAETLLFHLSKGNFPGRDGGPAAGPGAGDPSPAVCQPERDRGGTSAPGPVLADGQQQSHRRLYQKLYPPSGDSGSGEKGQPESRGAYSRGGGGFSGGGRIPSGRGGKTQRAFDESGREQLPSGPGPGGGAFSAGRDGDPGISGEHFRQPERYQPGTSGGSPAAVRTPRGKTALSAPGCYRGPNRPGGEALCGLL